MGKPMTDINENSIQDNSLAASGSGNDFTPAPDSPFLRELRAELNRHAEQAVESAAATAQERIRQNADELEHQRRAASDESFQKWKEEFAKTAGGAMDNELDSWRSRLRSEMNLAQAEWSELLQSSLDGSMQRLVEQLSQRSQEVQRGEETRMSERFADLIHPVNEAAAKAGQTLGEIRFGLETQVAAARSSLEDMERSAVRIRENSAQFEAAGHDSRERAASAARERARRADGRDDAARGSAGIRNVAENFAGDRGDGKSAGGTSGGADGSEVRASSRASSGAVARTRRARIADGGRIAAASRKAPANGGEQPARRGLADGLHSRRACSGILNPRAPRRWRNGMRNWTRAAFECPIRPRKH